MKKLLVFSALGLAILLTGCSLGASKVEQNQAQPEPVKEQGAAQTAPAQNQVVTKAPSATPKTVVATPNSTANPITKPVALLGDLNKGCGDQNGECCFKYMYCQGQKMQSLYSEQCNCCSGKCTYWQTENNCDLNCQQTIMTNASSGVLDADKISYCDKIQGGVTTHGGPDTKYNSGDCYGWVISNNLDSNFSLCSKISNKSNIGDCYNMIVSSAGIMNDNPINCLDIPDGYRDYCIVNRATNGNISDLSMCDYVKLQSKAGLCYLWVIMKHYNSDLSQCNKAKTQEAKDECISLGANFGLHLN
ncbi:MAG: hypothetical protein WC668_03160 [Patescibacteria group bacterium]|jgi:hypothetical protein